MLRTSDITADSRRRLDVLEALYVKRRYNPDQPTVTLAELAALEDRILTPGSVDPLQFVLWYLVESALARQAENGWSITAHGVDFLDTVWLEASAESVKTPHAQLRVLKFPRSPSDPEPESAPQQPNDPRVGIVGPMRPSDLRLTRRKGVAAPTRGREKRR